jgi:hypothetical protein
VLVYGSLDIVFEVTQSDALHLLYTLPTKVKRFPYPELGEDLIFGTEKNLTKGRQSLKLCLFGIFCLIIRIDILIFNKLEIVSTATPIHPKNREKGPFPEPVWKLESFAI